jgi:hypothetical protein
MRANCLLIPVLIVVAAPSVAMDAGGPQFSRYTSEFGLEHCEALVPDGGNDYFSLRPGRYFRYEGMDEDRFVEVELTVLNETRTVPFEVRGRRIIAITRVIEERERIDGELVDVTRSLLACCPRSRNIYCFGEEVDEYGTGSIVSHGGSWLAGVDGAKPGLFMPALFLVGSRYYQEYAPGVAMDRSEHLESGLTVETPAGIFHECVLIAEIGSPESAESWEPGGSVSEGQDDDDDEETLKTYALGVGLVVDGELVLVEYHD